jgi:hypothetical protein
MGSDAFGRHLGWDRDLGNHGIGLFSDRIETRTRSISSATESCRGHRQGNSESAIIVHVRCTDDTYIGHELFANE